MKKIFITGATGFIGANLTREAIKKKIYEVHILSRDSSDFWRLNDIKEDIIIHNCDLLDYENIKSILETVSPEYIFHLATYGSYPRRQTEELKILNTNIKGTFNLLKASLDIDYKNFINTGSSSEYGTKDKPMKETDSLEPNNVYGITKSTTTFLCKNFARQNNKPISTIRPFSVYGYYEESFRFIPEMIIKCIKNRDVNLTSGNQRRDFIFIEDVIRSYFEVAKKQGNKRRIYNVGSGRDHTIKETALLIKELTNSKNKLNFGKVKKEYFETDICWTADINKINSELGWKPEHSIEEGLKKTIEWFKDNIKLYD